MKYDNKKSLTENAMAGVDITEPSKPKYVVVQEWIIRSELNRIDRDGNMKADTIMECNDLPNDYYAVMKCEEGGDFYDEVESFHTSEEAWELYDKLMEGVE